MSDIKVSVGDWVRISERPHAYVVINDVPDSDGDIRVARVRNHNAESYAKLDNITKVIPGGLKDGDLVYVDDSKTPRVLRTARPDTDNECKVYNTEETYWTYIRWSNLTKVIINTHKGESTQSTNSQKETAMSNQAHNSEAARQVVQVIIVDPDAGLKPEDALVADLGQHVLQGPVDNLKLKLAMSPDVNLQSKLNAHNTKRSKLVDLDILNRTGQEVKMQPIEIEDLVWQIK